jgi:hypothetical protein
VVILAYVNLFKKLSPLRGFFLEKYNMVLLTIAMLIPMFCLGFVATQVVYADNYMAVSFPLFMLMFTIFQNYPFVVSKFLYASLAIFFIMLLPYNFNHPVKTYDFITTADYIKTIERPGEPILVYKPAIALPFSHYYDGPNTIVPIPHQVTFDTGYLVNIRDTNELKQSIQNIKTTSNSYLMLSDTTIYEGYLDMHRQMVQDYLYSHYNVTLDTLFYGWSNINPLRIWRFEKKVAGQ